MTTVSDNYRTLSRNTDDVAKYLKCYFGHDLSDDCRSLTAEKIFSILKDCLYESAFEKYLTCYILDKKSAELSENETPTEYCARKFRSSGLIGQSNIFCREKLTMTEPLLKKQLKNRFGGVTPSRENIFLPAFALEMTGSELSDILIKGIRDKGINYKDPAEGATPLSFRMLICEMNKVCRSVPIILLYRQYPNAADLFNLQQNAARRTPYLSVRCAPFLL